MNEKHYVHHGSIRLHFQDVNRTIRDNYRDVCNFSVWGCMKYTYLRLGLINSNTQRDLILPSILLIYYKQSTLTCGDY